MTPQRRSAPDLGPAAGPSFPQPASRWQIQLLGRFRARNGDIVITRLPTQAMTALLARLATAPGRQHAREALVELIWPDCKGREAGARSLRTALTTLRKLFEPPGVVPGSVIGADRQCAWIEQSAVDCDAAQFEARVQAGHIEAARALYQGELLPGHYDDWILRARERLAEIHASLPRQLPSAAAPPPMQRGPDPVLRLVPSHPDAFIGRDAEVLALLERIVQHRLVTIMGFAGCGKTRLGEAVALQAQGFQVVAFVSLVDCPRPEHLHESVRRSLELERGAGSAADQVLTFLAGRRALLVLDNFEHLARLPAADALLSSLLAELPQLHLLVTSRRALHLPGESRFTLLPLPTPSDSDPLEVVASSPAIVLFCDRARRSRPEFQLSARNRQGLVALCRTLDGLPYQIEIAARKIRQFTPTQMCESIAHSASVLALSGPMARRNPRHGSRRIAIEWSWRLLTPRQRGGLAALALFRGGWTAEAAAAVIADASSRDMLEEFQLSSMIRLEVGSGRPARYSMLESLRDFLRGKLTSRRRAVLRQRHRAHYLAWAGGLSNDSAPLLAPELHNIADALASALADHDAEAGARLALSLAWYWTAQGVPTEILESMLALAAAVPASEALGCSLLCLLARLSMAAGSLETSRACADRALTSAGGLAPLRAEALVACAHVDWMARQDADAALPRLHEGMQLAAAAGLRAVLARARSLLAAIELVHFKRPNQASTLFAQAEAELQAEGDRYGALLAATGRIQCLNALRRYDAAIEAALSCYEEASRHHQVAILLLLCNRLSLSYEGARRFSDAVDICAQQAGIAAQHGMAYHFSYAIWNQCRPLARTRQPERAMLLMAFIKRHWEAGFGPLSADDRRNVEKVRRLARVQIGRARCDQLWAEGSSLAAAEARQLAIG